MNKQILNAALAVVLSGSALSAYAAASYTFTDLGTLGGNSSNAHAINTTGQVVGSSYPAYGAFHATLWNGTTATALGTLGGTTGGSSAHAINTAGQVAGWTYFTTAGGGTRATVWNGTTATYLGTLGDWSVASDINTAGQVAGWSLFDDQRHDYRATVWNGTTATDLGTLGGNSSEARAINDAGQVVGYASTANGDIRATLWNGTTTTDLNSLLDASTVSAGWVLNFATGINDNGWIVGTASNSLLGIDNHAFLLTPVPEAETWAMMLAGLGLVGWTTLRRRRAALQII